MLTYQNDPLMKQMSLAAVRVEQATGFPAMVTLAMSANESGWWKKVTGDFNFWGITRSPEDGPAKMCPTHEDITPAQLSTFRPDEQATAIQTTDLGNGRFRYTMSRWFASYPSLEASLTAYTEFFTKSPKRYLPAWTRYQKDHDANALLKNICEAGYATGPAETVEIAIAHQSNILDAVTLAKQDLAV